MERLIPVGSALRITQDQVRLLQLDNCVHGSSVTLSKRSAVISIGASYSVPGDKSMGQLAERIMFSTFDLAGQRQQLKGLSDLFAKGQWKAESNK
jgi:hypothetical protein